jgi:hypothetical protein
MKKKSCMKVVRETAKTVMAMTVLNLVLLMFIVIVIIVSQSITITANSILLCFNNKDLNSVALACKRTIQSERPPLVSEVIANFCGYGVLRGQRNRSPQPYSRFVERAVAHFLLFLCNYLDYGIA